MADLVECPECGDEYEFLGKHWYHNYSHRPSLTEEERGVVSGLLMGDGSLIRRDERNPYLSLSMITKEYLEWLDSFFGVLTTGVRLDKTAEELAQNSRDRGFSTTVNEENYHDCWKLTTRSLPELEQFNWYTDNGEKVWPDSIELTPKVLTHWYVGDGCWNNTNYHDNISIGASNEYGNENKIDSYFKQSNLPLPSNYGKYKGGMNVTFTVEDSYELFEYMDPAPPGFEYKFPKEYRDSTFYE